MLQDAIVLTAYESSQKAKDIDADSGTWTFYRIQTDKGVAVLRWLGTSNGYYGESVQFVEATGETQP